MREGRAVKACSRWKHSTGGLFLNPRQIDNTSNLNNYGGLMKINQIFTMVIIQSVIIKTEREVT